MIPVELVRQYATRTKPELIYDARRKHGPLGLKRKLEYFGVELESEIETLDDFPPELAGEARRVLAEAMARGEARHFAVKKNQPVIDEIREAYKLSGGETPRLGLQELTKVYESQLEDVSSMSEFKSARLTVGRDEFVPPEVRERIARLPRHATVRDREVEIDYDVEEHGGTRQGVARLRLPEKIARTLSTGEIPGLDRPVRFVVLRGQRGAVRADTLEDLQEKLALPWSPDEVNETADDREMLSHAEQEIRKIASEFRDHRRGGRGGGGGGRGRGGRGHGGQRSGGSGNRGRGGGGSGGHQRGGPRPSRRSRGR